MNRLLKPVSAERSSPSLETAVTQVSTGSPQRIAALDFTKGALVLLMVLYHWLNYFVGVEGSYYKYLRFLTPSFIFITGFLISHVYLRKYRVTDSRLPRRLLRRGLKLVGIFICLNLAIGALLRGAAEIPPSRWALYLAGSDAGQRPSFFVLLPIGYVLLLSAGLSVLCRLYKHVFHAASALLLLCVLVLGFFGFASAYLELISIGVLGISIGYIPMDWTRGIAKWPYALFLAYAGYLCAISIWHEVFFLQIAGVCLTLTLLYLAGSGDRGPVSIRNAVVLLGKYSLFAYIAQIGILQSIHGAVRYAGRGGLVAGLSLLAAAAFTLLSVAVLDRARAKVAAVNRLYAAVFA